MQLTTSTTTRAEEAEDLGHVPQTEMVREGVCDIYLRARFNCHFISTGFVEPPTYPSTVQARYLTRPLLFCTSSFLISTHRLLLFAVRHRIVMADADSSSLRETRSVEAKAW
jgi:hypothetical protein